GMVETGAKLFEQIAQPREAMRLDNSNDMTLGRCARAFEHGGDFNRMMSVIVENRDAVPFAGAREAPLHATEFRQRPADPVVGHAEYVRNRVRRRGLEHSGVARHRQRGTGKLVCLGPAAPAKLPAEARHAALALIADQPHAGLWIDA